MKAFLPAALSLSFLALPALAQDDPFVNDGQLQDDQTQQNGQVQVQAQQPQVDPQPQQQQQVFEDPNFQEQQQTEPEYEEQQVERGARQASVYLTFPIFLTSAEEALFIPGEVPGYDPGFGVGIGARFGWEFGMFVPEIHVGIQTNISGTPGLSRLTNIFFSGGGRFQILNPSRFIPFVSVAVRGNFWSEYEESDVAGVPATDSSLHLGIMGGAGVAIEISRTFGLEAAVDFVADIPLDSTIFNDAQFQLVPRLGGTLYF